MVDYNADENKFKVSHPLTDCPSHDLTYSLCASLRRQLEYEIDGIKEWRELAPEKYTTEPSLSIWSWTLLTTLPLNGVTPGDMITNTAARLAGRAADPAAEPLCASPWTHVSWVPHSTLKCRGAGVRPLGPTEEAQPQELASEF